MKTLRKIRKDAKALSPVVASIILIAVTVAVSIAVAAWMGALSIGFMQTEQLTITNVEFDGAGGITLSVQNSGTTDVVISSATVNGDAATVTGAPQSIVKNTPDSVELTGVAYNPGDSLQIKLMSAKGNYFPYNVVVP